MQWQVILEYVGHVCFRAGTLKASRNDSGKVSPSWPSPNAEHVFQERRRVKQFLDWLLAQRLCLRNRFFSYQCSVGGFGPADPATGRGSVTVKDVADRDVPS